MRFQVRIKSRSVSVGNYSIISLLKLTKIIISSLHLLPNVPHLVVDFELVEAVNVVDRLSTQLITLLR